MATKETAAEKAAENKKNATDLEISKAGGLQVNFKALGQEYLSRRFSDNPEFQKNFLKTFSDLVFSQDEEMLEKLEKTRKNTLLNAVFKATEAGASFAKKEVSFIPFQAFKKVTEKGAEKKVATGEYDAVVIFDINFQKQQILKLKNCKRFFTAEVHEGVKVIEDLTTGTTVFEGENDVTKPTIGYYASFITDEGEKYDKFMTVAEIIERAKFSPQYKAENYKTYNNNIHLEKIVVRNLIKEIPRISDELKSILSVDESHEYADYIEIKDEIEAPKPVNKLEEAKREMAHQASSPEPEKVEPKASGIKPNAEAFFNEKNAEDVKGKAEPADDDDFL